MTAKMKSFVDSSAVIVNYIDSLFHSRELGQQLLELIWSLTTCNKLSLYKVVVLFHVSILLLWNKKVKENDFFIVDFPFTWEVWIKLGEWHGENISKMLINCRNLKSTMGEWKSIAISCFIGKWHDTRISTSICRANILTVNERSSWWWRTQLTTNYQSQVVGDEGWTFPHFWPVNTNLTHRSMHSLPSRLSHP